MRAYADEFGLTRTHCLGNDRAVANAGRGGEPVGVTGEASGRDRASRGSDDCGVRADDAAIRQVLPSEARRGELE